MVNKLLLYFVLVSTSLSAQDSVYISFVPNFEHLSYSSLHGCNGWYPIHQQSEIPRNSLLRSFQYIDPIELIADKNTLELYADRDRWLMQAPWTIVPKTDTMYYNPLALKKQCGDCDWWKFHEFTLKNSYILDSVQMNHYEGNAYPYNSEPKYYVKHKIGESWSPIYRRVELPKNRDSLIQAFYRQTYPYRQSIRDSIIHNLDPFFIQRLPVSNEQYNLFVRSVQDSIVAALLYQQLGTKHGAFLLNCSKKERKYARSLSDAEALNKFGLNSAYIQAHPEIYDDPEYLPILASLYLPQVPRFYSRREIDPKKILFRNVDDSLIAVIPALTNETELLNRWDLTPQTYAQYFLKAPVLNLTIAQQRAYCYWLSKQLNNKPQARFSYHVRLPTLLNLELSARVATAPVWRDRIQAYDTLTDVILTRLDGHGFENLIGSDGYTPLLRPFAAPAKTSSDDYFSLLASLLSSTAECVYDPASNELKIQGSDPVHRVVSADDFPVNTLFVERPLPPNNQTILYGFRPVIFIKSKP